MRPFRVWSERSRIATSGESDLEVAPTAGRAACAARWPARALQRARATLGVGPEAGERGAPLLGQARHQGLGEQVAAAALVALLLAREGEPRASIAHTGDSRAYCLRGGALTQLTIDHRLVDDARRAGLPEAEIAALPAGVIVEALGVRASPRIELAAVAVEPGDVFLLCTDGLTDALDPRAIAALLRANEGDLPAAARALVEAATAPDRRPRPEGRDGLSVGDNTTVLLVQVGP